MSIISTFFISLSTSVLVTAATQIIIHICENSKCKLKVAVNDDLQSNAELVKIKINKSE